MYNVNSMAFKSILYKNLTFPFNLKGYIKVVYRRYIAITPLCTSLELFQEVYIQYILPL